ncbi:MAG: hypothetical protein DMG88_05270 [Acidobacteria bacterium]|nr:MAG: hypothetical protein DMG88_05270 [Acidobacteriota bacterium]
MLQFVCDSCGAIKLDSETWIVGMAAEAVGTARREVTIQSAWDRATAMHPLAVHFCSIQCKDDYMAQLFAPTVPAKEIIHAGPAKVVIEQSGPSVERVVVKAKSRIPRWKRAA